MLAVFAFIAFVVAAILAVIGWRAPDRHFGWFAVALIAVGLAIWLAETGAGLFP